MRRALLLSSGLHALAVATTLGLRWPTLPEPAEPARIEVVFGTGADAVPAPPVAAVARRDPADGATETVTFPISPRPAATEPGIRPERPDPTMLLARDAAGNRGPDYPPTAWQQREQGTVLLRLYIGADGTVARVDIRKSSGVAALDAAAVTALSAWRFLPAERAGQPIASYRDQPVSFVLQ
jgi:protein TonB